MRSRAEDRMALEVLGLKADGKKPREIAKILECSIRTVYRVIRWNDSLRPLSSSIPDQAQVIEDLAETAAAVEDGEKWEGKIGSLLSGYLDKAAKGLGSVDPDGPRGLHLVLEAVRVLARISIDLASLKQREKALEIQLAQMEHDARIATDVAQMSDQALMDELAKVMELPARKERHAN